MSLAGVHVPLPSPLMTISGLRCLDVLYEWQAQQINYNLCFAVGNKEIVFLVNNATVASQTGNTTDSSQEVCGVDPHRNTTICLQATVSNFDGNGNWKCYDVTIFVGFLVSLLLNSKVRILCRLGNALQRYDKRPETLHVLLDSGRLMQSPLLAGQSGRK
ncbi:MAG: hypothetical protein ACXV2C_00035 [Candidatus Bathyarchaeia archaeon]